MARIKTYALDSEINAADKVVGTDGTPGADLGKTKNFSVSSLVSFIGTGGDILTKKVVVSTAELKTLNSPVKILIDNPGPDKNIVQIYGIVAGVSGNSATDKLVFPNDLEITTKSTVGVTPFKYVIPQAIVNRTTAPAPYYVPSLVAGETEFGSKLVLQSAAAPTETGTAVTTMTFWITYRIFNIEV
jgi:hypothetical protein